MPMLIGLPGRRKPLEAEYFTTPRQCAAILHRGLGATANGENGAINVWPVKGGFRGHWMQFRAAVEEFTWKTPYEAAPVLKRWLREINKPNAKCAEIRRQMLAGEYDFTTEAE